MCKLSEEMHFTADNFQRAGIVAEDAESVVCELFLHHRQVQINVFRKSLSILGNNDFTVRLLEEPSRLPTVRWGSS